MVDIARNKTTEMVWVLPHRAPRKPEQPALWVEPDPRRGGGACRSGGISSATRQGCYPQHQTQ